MNLNGRILGKPGKSKKFISGNFRILIFKNKLVRQKFRIHEYWWSLYSVAIANEISRLALAEREKKNLIYVNKMAENSEEPYGIISVLTCIYVF
jgi:hypothetical protein